MSRLVPVALVFGAALADQAALHSLAFDALLVAVPLTAAAALRTVADRVDGSVDAAQTYLWGAALTLLLVATALRAPAVGDSAVPPLARSALLACVAVFCLQAIAALANELRERP